MLKEYPSSSYEFNVNRDDGHFGISLGIHGIISYYFVVLQQTILDYFYIPKIYGL